METFWNDYCNAINLSPAQVDRVNNIINEYKFILDERVVDIFIGDQILTDGTRSYLNLFLFSETYICEAKGFLSEDDFDFTVIKHKITYLQIQKRDFKFNVTPSSTSSLTISISLGVVSGLGLSCIFKASGRNCVFLEKILTKYLLPNTINKSGD